MIELWLSTRVPRERQCVCMESSRPGLHACKVLDLFRLGLPEENQLQNHSVHPISVERDGTLCHFRHFFHLRI